MGNFFKFKSKPKLLRTLVCYDCNGVKKFAFWDIQAARFKPSKIIKVLYIYDRDVLATIETMVVLTGAELVEVSEIMALVRKYNTDKNKTN